MAAGAIVHHFSDYLTASDRLLSEDVSSTVSLADLHTVRVAGVDAGAFATAAALDFYSAPSLGRRAMPETADAAQVLRRYLCAAMLTAVAADRLLAREHFDAVISHHGFMLPQGLILQSCTDRGIRVIGWWTKFRRECVMFGERGFAAMLKAEPSAAWDQTLLTAEMNQRLDEYFERRSRGGQDWTARPLTSELPPASSSAIGERLERGCCVGLLPNLRWDAVAEDRNIPFAKVTDWIFATIDFFADHPDLTLIIRLHPHNFDVAALAEQRITARFPVLPPNVLVIRGDDPISTYAVMARCNAVIVWASTSGLEFAARGLPVLVAGDAWYRGRGFTLDAYSKEEYDRLLQRVPFAPMSDSVLSRARQCAYHFFFRHMIPLSCLRADSSKPSSDASGSNFDAEDSSALEAICSGILERRPFLYTADAPNARLATAVGALDGRDPST